MLLVAIIHLTYTLYIYSISAGTSALVPSLAPMADGKIDNFFAVVAIQGNIRPVPELDHPFRRGNRVPLLARLLRVSLTMRQPPRRLREGRLPDNSSRLPAHPAETVRASF